MPRISYVTPEQAGDDLEPLYDQVKRQMGMVPHLIQVLGHAPGIAGGLVQAMGAGLQAQGLGDQEKELAALVPSAINGCGYCLGHHRPAGSKAGLSDAQMDALPEAPEEHFDAKQRALIAFAAELTRDIVPKDATFGALKEHYDEAQIVAIAGIVGVFNVFNRIAEGFRIEPE